MGVNFGELPREEVKPSGNSGKEWQQRLEFSREHSTELQNNVSEVQQAKLGIALRQLMDRTDNNPEIVNNLNTFLDALSYQSSFGNSSESIASGRQHDLGEFLGEAAKALRLTVGGGNRSAEKIDLSKWSTPQ